MLAAGWLTVGCATPEDASARQEQQSRPRASKPIECRVTRISDGDSFICGSAGRVRLLMIDAPELAQGAEGRRAQQTLELLAPKGTVVLIESDVRAKDDYDRILGYAFLPDGRMLNEEMAKAGMVTALVYPPNVRYADRIRKAVREAQNAKRGLWSTGFFDCTPRDYRAGRCGRSQDERSVKRK